MIEILMPLVVNCPDNMFGLQYGLERFRFTVWFGTIMIYSMVWNDFDLQYGLERF